MLSDKSFLPALLLVTAIFAPACKPDSGEETATDTATDTAATDTAATDTAATDTDATDSATTDSATTEPTTDGEATETGDTDPTGGEEACVAPDPAASAEVGIDLGAWPIEAGEPDAIDLAAECTVQSVSDQGGAIEIGLSCSEGDQVDMPVKLFVTAPADFAVEVAVDAQVRLQSHWQADGHHIGAGEWFVLHDATSGALLLAGLDYDSATAANEALSPLSLAPVEGVCEPTCGEDCINVDGTERLAFAFVHDDGPSVELIDRSRGSVSAGGRKYDIILGQAVANFCLNCWNDYVWLIGATAE